jgi:hypothetical protein
MLFSIEDEVVVIELTISITIGIVMATTKNKTS